MKRRSKIETGRGKGKDKGGAEVMGVGRVCVEMTQRSDRCGTREAMLTQQVPCYSQDRWGGREERNRWFRVTSAVGKWQLRAGQSGPGPVSGGWADPTGWARRMASTPGLSPYSPSTLPWSR